MFKSNWMIFCLSCICVLRGDLLAIEQPAISYRVDLNGIHIVEIDPKQTSILCVKGLENGLGKETVESMAKRYGAAAAINGGFFNGLRPIGALKLHNRWFSSPVNGRAAIGWSPSSGRPLIDRISMTWKLYVGSTSLTVDGINQDDSTGIKLYFPWFHRSALTTPDNIDIVVLKGKIQSISRGGGKAIIPTDGFIVSLPAERQDLMKLFKNGVSCTYKAEPTNPLWESMPMVLGGTPLLLRKGEIVSDMNTENVLTSFLTLKAPRTAIGIKKDGTWVCVVVKGQILGIDVGMTIDQLAHYMKELGCVDALNLDGGSSSSLIIDGHSFVSSSEEVSDAILFLKKTNKHY